MKHLKYLLVALGLLISSQANAATCFWVGGTGNYDNANTTSWSSASGGSTGTCAATGGIPKNTIDIATFDASSCAGACTITVCGAATANCPTSSGVLSISQISFFACTNTCVLDFSAINPAVTLTTELLLSGGTGTRTLHMGSNTWTFSRGGAGTAFDATTSTGLTFDAGTSTMFFTGNGELVKLGTSLSYNVLTFSAAAGGCYVVTGTTPTIATMNVTGPVCLQGASASQTFNLTNAPTWTGTASNPILIETAQTISTVTWTFAITSGAPSLDWTALRNIVFSGGTLGTAKDTLNLGGNSGITITAPSGGGGGGHIIGG